jgi:hypothetical protein
MLVEFASVLGALRGRGQQTMPERDAGASADNR